MAIYVSKKMTSIATDMVLTLDLTKLGKRQFSELVYSLETGILLGYSGLPMEIAESIMKRYCVPKIHINPYRSYWRDHRLHKSLATLFEQELLIHKMELVESENYKRNQTHYDRDIQQQFDMLTSENGFVAIPDIKRKHLTTKNRSNYKFYELAKQPEEFIELVASIKSGAVKSVSINLLKE